MPRWVRREIHRARKAGWSGRVLSGFRTTDEQLAAAKRYVAELGKTMEEVYPHGPLASNHCRASWPGGAVDVTNPRGLRDALRRAPRRWTTRRRLVWAIDVGHNDAAHFSSNGH
jgi:hypothetical protein